MAKIPNWSRVDRPTIKSSELIWKHDNKPVRIAVKSESPGYMIWKGERRGSDSSGTTEWNQRLKNSQNRSGLFETKDQARRSAVKWMRNHPNP